LRQKLVVLEDNKRKKWLLWTRMQRRLGEQLGSKNLLGLTILLRSGQRLKEAVESWLKLGSPQKRSAVVPYEQVWRV
jgi:hypothetical protein